MQMVGQDGQDPGFETCELVTITTWQKNRDSTLGGGMGTRLLEAAVGVWTEVFKYISFSNPSAQYKKKSLVQQQGLKSLQL